MSNIDKIASGNQFADNGQQTESAGDSDRSALITMSGDADRSALIAMSGGVDSSVAAYLMLRDGYRLEGTTMRLYRWDKKYRNKTRTCCTDRDLNDASEVAARLNIPYEVTDYE